MVQFFNPKMTVITDCSYYDYLDDPASKIDGSGISFSWLQVCKGGFNWGLLIRSYWDGQLYNSFA